MMVSPPVTLAEQLHKRQITKSFIDFLSYMGSETTGGIVKGFLTPGIGMNA